jgi:hypothetical protein
MPRARQKGTEILALGSLAKWPRRCSAAEGTAACGARGRPPGLACSVPDICARAQLKRRAPARLGAAATNCGPCPAGAGGSPVAARCATPPRARWRAQRPCSGGRGAPRCQMGTPGATLSPRRGSQPLASGARQARRGRGRLGASDLGGGVGELFAAASGGVGSSENGDS